MLELLQKTTLIKGNPTSLSIVIFIFLEFYFHSNNIFGRVCFHKFSFISFIT